MKTYLLANLAQIPPDTIDNASFNAGTKTLLNALDIGPFR